jgi:hypothetical protein
VSLTLRGLIDVDTHAIIAAGEAWTRLADDLDEATDDLIHGTQGLEDAWPAGTGAADAAHARTTNLRHEASNAVPPCRAIGRTLREHADTVQSLQQLVHTIRDEATRNGYDVDLSSGTVSAGEHTARDSASGQVLAQAIQSYVTQFQDVLDRAVSADRQTVGAIQRNLPDEVDGFTSLAATPVTQQQVHNMTAARPADVKAWWDTLTSEQQDQALHDFPDLLGNLNGIPAADRDTANRFWLATEKQRVHDQMELTKHHMGLGFDPITGQRTADGRILDGLQAEAKNLDDISKGLDRAGAAGMLLGIDPSGDGKVIISVGNPDTATDAAVWVPGLGTDASKTDQNVGRMQMLNARAQAHLKPGQSVATVYWLGYDAPEVIGTSVAFEQRSRDGAGPYSAFMDGIHATHEGNLHLTAMGHSYGTTVLGEAAKSGNLHVDDIVTAGSPGMHVDHASDLHIDPQHVWAGSAADDPVSRPSIVTHDAVAAGTLGGPLGMLEGWAVGRIYEQGHGISPDETAFGANSYTVDTSGHTGYWNNGTASLDNQAAVIAGDYGGVRLQHGKAPGS